jgi:hypothetical protein
MAETVGRTAQEWLNVQRMQGACDGNGFAGTSSPPETSPGAPWQIAKVSEAPALGTARARASPLTSK